MKGGNFYDFLLASWTKSEFTAAPHGYRRMVRWCWVNFQCRSVLLIWIIVGQGPTALAAAGAGGGCLDIISLIYYFSLLFPTLWETAQYSLKYIYPKTTNQPIMNIEALSKWNSLLLERMCSWGANSVFKELILL